MNMYDITDKVFLVTGGAAGIGAQIVRQLLKEGAKYVAALDIDTNAGKTLEMKLGKERSLGKFDYIKCDVTTEELNIVYEQLINKYGFIDTVINNAGLCNENPSSFDKMIEVNVTSLVKMTMKAYTQMRKDKGGRGGTVVNIASIGALKPYSVLPIYCATKSAVLHFTNCLGIQPHFTRSGVRLITVCFGITMTSMIATVGKHVDQETENEMCEELGSGKHIEQSAESAAIGVVEAIKFGTPASTWLVMSNKPAKDITDTLNKSYEIRESIYH